MLTNQTNRKHRTIQTSTVGWQPCVGMRGIAALYVTDLSSLSLSTVSGVLQQRHAGGAIEGFELSDNRQLKS